MSGLQIILEISDSAVSEKQELKILPDLWHIVKNSAIVYKTVEKFAFHHVVKYLSVLLELL